MLIFSQWLYTKKGYPGEGYRTILAILFHFLLLVVISHELMHWSTIARIEKVDKYGLSIFWALYALFLVGYGIWRGKASLRIAGIVLVGVTLGKLFFYDISNLSMIIKTFLFLALGFLLLIMSFLYNKYKDAM